MIRIGTIVFDTKGKTITYSLSFKHNISTHGFSIIGTHFYLIVYTILLLKELLNFFYTTHRDKFAAIIAMRNRSYFYMYNY